MQNALALPIGAIEELSFDEIELVDGGISGVNAALLVLGGVGLVASGVGLGLAAAYGGATVAGAVGLGAAGVGASMSAFTFAWAIYNSD